MSSLFLFEKIMVLLFLFCLRLCRNLRGFWSLGLCCWFRFCWFLCRSLFCWSFLWSSLLSFCLLDCSFLLFSSLILLQASTQASDFLVLILNLITLIADGGQQGIQQTL